MLNNSTIKFLNALAKNNNKEWFDKNRPLYEDAKNDFAAFTQNVITSFGKKEPAIASLQAKECVFRINRDVRFSKDKSPYKKNMAAYFNEGGKKSTLAGYYFHCEPDASFVAGGIWMPMAPHLKKIRQEIDYNFDAFKKIVQSKKFKTLFADVQKGEDVSLVTMPKGYEKDNPAAEYLKLKSFIGSVKISDETLTSKNLVAVISNAFETVQPLVNFLNQAMRE
jgi:uncharacterized protein (TIGR02453 family)